MSAYQFLVVDDEPSVGRAIKLILKSDGHDVQTVPSGNAALALLEHRQFDLIITDYAMDGMQGDELASRIKQLRPDQAIIMVTAFADDFNIHGKSSGGAACVLLKPFSIAALKEAIARILPTKKPN